MCKVFFMLLYLRAERECQLGVPVLVRCALCSVSRGDLCRLHIRTRLRVVLCGVLFVYPEHYRAHHGAPGVNAATASDATADETEIRYALASINAGACGN